MQVIRPIAITDDTLVAASIPEQDEPEFNPATAYAVDDVVQVTSVQSLYQSVSAANTGNDPITDNGTNWIRISSTNRWRAFDKQIRSPATAPGAVSYTLVATSLVTAVAVFGMTGDTVELEVAGGGETQVFTRNLRTRRQLRGWYTYFFGGFDKDPTAVFLDLPFFGIGATYTITVTAAQGGAGIGQLLYGRQVRLGRTRWGSDVTILSGSRKERDIFLNLILVKRATALRASFEVIVRGNLLAATTRLMEELDAEPSVYIGDQDTAKGLIVYGVFFDYIHRLDLPDKSEFTITVEGLK